MFERNLHSDSNNSFSQQSEMSIYLSSSFSFNSEVNTAFAFFDGNRFGKAIFCRKAVLK